MTWFKVGDELTHHPRVRRAGNAAMGLWVRAGTWCSEHLTEGWISHEDARDLGSAAEIRKLVSVGLWYEEERDGQRGYQFHRWAANGVGQPRQPTRAQVEAERESTRKRQERWRSKKKSEQDDDHVDVSSDDAFVTRYETGDSAVSNGAPDPTRPGPSKETSDDVSLNAQERAVRVTTLDFEEFWRIYPRKAGKDRAKPAFLRAARRATPAVVIEGARRLAADPNLPEMQFVPYPATWLNGGGWDDDPLPSREAPKAASGPQVQTLKRL